MRQLAHPRWDNEVSAIGLIIIIKHIHLMLQDIYPI